MTLKKKNPATRLYRYLIFVIFYIVLVVLWGAYVRATGSGAGCGSHWPLCNGQVIPTELGIKTQIEFSHRLSSGISLPLVLFAGIWIFRNYPKGVWIRKTATIACVSILLEALIGAGLVLFELVAQNKSVTRTVSISLHFINTLVLLGSLVLTATSASREGKGWKKPSLTFKKQAYAFMALFLMVGIAGAVTALGDTLFPALSLAHGISQDWERSSHFLVKLRVIHPLLAVVLVLFSTPWIYSFSHRNYSSALKRSRSLLVALLGLNVMIGLWNLVWLAPISLQILHLCMAMSIWIVWILFFDQAMEEVT